MPKTRSIYIRRASLVAVLVLATGGIATAGQAASLSTDVDLLRSVVSSLVRLVAPPDTEAAVSTAAYTPPTPTEVQDSTLDLPTDGPMGGPTSSGHEDVQLGESRTGGGNGDDAAGPWPSR